MEKMILGYQKLCWKLGMYVISVPLFIMASVEVLNTVGRKVSLPFPCTVEIIESLMVISVWFGLSMVSAERRHVKISLIADRFPLWTQNLFEAAANFFGLAVYTLWLYGSWLRSFESVGLMEVRIGEHDFPVWPFRLLLAIGMSLFAIQLVFNVVKFMRRAFGQTSYARHEQEAGN